MLDNGFPGSSFKPLQGTEEATIDDKGRILVAKKKRERLGDNFVIALSETGCLAAYPEATWMSMLADIWKVPAINMGRQQYARMVIGTAVDELKFDGQGRVVIPKELRAMGKLQEKVVLVGAMDKLEIWGREEWDKYNEDPDSYGLKRIETLSRASRLMKEA
jgi:MraZ protein